MFAQWPTVISSPSPCILRVRQLRRKLRVSYRRDYQRLERLMSLEAVGNFACIRIIVHKIIAQGQFLGTPPPLRGMLLRTVSVYGIYSWIIGRLIHEYMLIGANLYQQLQRNSINSGVGVCEARSMERTGEMVLW